MSLGINQEFPTSVMAIKAAFGLDIGKSLYIWFNYETDLWQLTDWKNHNEKLAKGKFICIRPDAELELNDPFIT
jgi:hypothetical protein